MKKILLSAFFLFSIALCFSQTIPNGVTGPTTKTPIRTPLYYPDPSKDYVRTLVPVKPITDSSQVNINALIEDVQVTTQYFDYLSRPYETVIKQASPTKKDYIAPVAYDEFSRVAIQYLPYVATTGNYNDGKFKVQPIIADSAFHNTQFPNEDIYYGQQIFDGSPLNRVKTQYAPGNSWGGAGKGIISTQRANTTADSVRLWTIAISSEDDVPATTSRYQAGSLFVQELTDERGIKAVKYIDELGRTILTKTQLAATPSTGHAGWLCTYYVYDEMNHLRMVITPKAVEALNNTNANWNLTTNATVNNNLCYAHYYDNRDRETMKRIPGKGKIYIAYDKMDRVVLTQDANLRTTSQWSFIKYDGQSRPDTTGLITMTGLTSAQVISNAAASTDYPTLTGTYTVMAVNYYDDYGWISGSIPTGTLITTNINSTNFITTYNASPDYAQQITQSNRIRGAVTGTKKLVLNTSTYLYTVTIYDDKGRGIQTKQTNYTGGTDVLTAQYSFSNRLLHSHLQHQKNGNTTQTHTLLTKYDYDHIGRLETITKNIDNSGDKTIVTNSYNELGQLSNKAFGSNLETQDFAYNIRGWLSGINKNFVETTTGTNFFGEELFYDYGFSQNQYNGNIAGIKWKSTGDDIQRAYGFSYDSTNRLTKADFTQQNEGSTLWTNDKMDFSVSKLVYDANGNILSMKQRGVNINTPVTIDSLSYQYFSNSNQLQKVSDAITDNTPWGDFKDTTLTADDYVYDVNGNIVKDNNKHLHTSTGANGITYNFLDKPTNINVNGKGSIAYVYDAGGMLLQKTTTDNRTGIKTVSTYVASFVYEKTMPSATSPTGIPDTLQYALHEEGRIRWQYTSGSNGNFIYDYFLKDHLGNIRTVITEEKDTAFYPAAAMELSNAASDTTYYMNVAETRASKPPGYPTDLTYSNPNNYVAKVKAATGSNKIGPGILLRVMSGDKFTARVDSWYNKNGAGVQQPVSAVNDIINALLGSIPGVSGNKVLSNELTNATLNPSITDFISTRDAGYGLAKPRAFLNYILLDDQMNLVYTNDNRNSGWKVVGADTTYTPLSISNRPITKNGFLYVYVSNETPNIDVYFDQLQVTHIKGSLLQEEGYYPFGGTIKSISSSAALKLQSCYKYNSGTALNEDLDVDYYETYFRNYDAQIGRFTGVDLMTENSYSVTPYQYALNDPLFYNDPFGAEEQAPDYSEFWGAVLDLFDASPNGINLHSDGTGGWNPHAFESNMEAFGSLSSYIQTTNGWGKEGAVGSYETARQNYRSTFGEDPGPAPIIVKAHNDWNWLGYSYLAIDNWGDAMHQLQMNILREAYGTCPDCLDPETVGHNLLGLTYPGGNNPLSYNKKYNYSYRPKNLSEYPAIGHDRRYDNLHISGLKGVLTDTRSIGADWKFVSEEIGIAINPAADIKTRLNAAFLGGLMELGTMSKTIYQLMKPDGLSETIMWYNLSSEGVTDMPSSAGQ